MEEDIKQGKKCLDNYTQNKTIIKRITEKNTTLKAVALDGMPKATNVISNPTANMVIQIDESLAEVKEFILQKNAVELARDVLDSESKYIIDHVYDVRDLKPKDIYFDYGTLPIQISQSTYNRKIKAIRQKVGEMYRIQKR